MKLTTETIVFNADRNATLDTYVIEHGPNSPSPDKVHPAIVICPGGGYNHISEGESLPAALPFLAAGYHAFVLSYSINDDSRYPNPLIDFSMAVRWVRANAARFKIDPDCIAILGFSAGGNCAAMLATQWHRDHWKAEEDRQIAAANMRAIEDVSNRPNAAILCYATTDLFAFPNLEQTRTRESGIGIISVERVPESNPIDHVSVQTCPTFLWHTAKDATVPARQSMAFASKLLEFGVPVELHMYERGAHGLSVGTRLANPETWEQTPPEVTGWVDLAIAWLNHRFGR